MQYYLIVPVMSDAGNMFRALGSYVVRRTQVPAGPSQGVPL